MYNFWKLVPEASRHDVDAVIEANVLFYLGERPETQPIIEYFIRVLRGGEEDSCDRWYLNRFMFYYAVSRNFHAGVVALGEVRDESVARIVSARSPTDRSAMAS